MDVITNKYVVSGMACGHCELSVRDEVGAVSGVEDVVVSARTGDLIVTSHSPIDDAQILSAVDEAGYSAERVG